MPGREFSDEALLHQLAAFLAYEHRHGRLCLAEWMETKDFAWADRTFLEVAYMGATVAQEHAS
jgi:hypothetical protein